MAEDRKFEFKDGKFVNRVSGEAIPDEEPVMLFRARDRRALTALLAYLDEVEDTHHQQAVTDRIQEFRDFKAMYPERLKEPGITRDIRLNSDGD